MILYELVYAFSHFCTLVAIVHRKERNYTKRGRVWPIPKNKVISGITKPVSNWNICNCVTKVNRSSSNALFHLTTALALKHLDAIP